MGKRSSVWEYYESNEANPKCKMCKKVIMASGNTTNLTRHLKNKHPTLIVDISKDHNEEMQPKIDSAISNITSFKGKFLSLNFVVIIEVLLYIRL